jgi:hypothetical protein
MKPNIPDHVPSVDELKKLIKQDFKKTIDGYTAEQLCELADIKMEELIEECSDPIAHKVLAIRILDHLINWHEVMSFALFECNKVNCIAWAKGQAQLEVARDTIARASISPNDFISPESFDPKGEL